MIKIINEKQMLKKLIIIALALIITCLPLHAWSEHVPADMIDKSSRALVSLKLMIGDENGNLKLNDNLTRCEFVTLVNRMMGYDKEDYFKNADMPFSDVQENHWAYNNIKAAVSNGLINGYTDNTFRPDNKVTFVEAQAVILRALGYQSQITKAWPEGIIEKSLELNLGQYLSIDKDKQLTRGEASILIYNALTIDFYK